MSRMGPAPGRNLDGGGNDGLGCGQWISDPHLNFTANGDRQRPSDRTESDSGSSSGGRQAVGGHGSQRRHPRLAIPLPSPGTSSELRFSQNSDDSTPLSPEDERTSAVQRFKKPVPKVVHPACLTPGHCDSSQEINRDQREPSYASVSQSASVKAPDAETSTLASATSQLFHTSERAGSRTDVSQDEGFGLLTQEEDAAMRGEVILRGDGYRLLDAQRHPEISHVAHPARQPATAASKVPERFTRSGWQTQNRRGIRAQTPPQTPGQTPSDGSASISSIKPQPTTSSAPNSPGTTLSSASFSFPPPSPPPRVSCDVVERNSFEAATQFYFFAENVGRGDIDDIEHFVALDRDCEAELGARRLSLMWQEWCEWRERLGEVGKWTVGF